MDASEPDGVSPAVGEDGFHAVSVTASGDERWVPWRRLPQVVDEIGGPVRACRSVHGQRKFPGWYPYQHRFAVATTTPTKNSTPGIADLLSDARRVR